jgi:hypothetical protein
MATKLNTDTYAIVASKSDYADGAQQEFHGTQDKRWHSVERAASLSRAGWSIIDITADGKSDKESSQALINRHGFYTQFATANAMAPTVEKTNGTVEKTMEVSFVDQERLAQPLRNLGKLVTSINQTILKGKLPIDSANSMALESFHALRILGVSSEVVMEALKSEYPELVRTRKSE